MGARNNRTVWIAVAGAVVVTCILVFGTIWMGQNGKADTEKAVRAVSLLYLDELAGRREQVVSANLQKYIDDMDRALDLMTVEDLLSEDRLTSYQARMKRLFDLEKFAFVDADGLIHTSEGIQDNISDYAFDYQNLTRSEISLLNLDSADEKKVVIATPVNLRFRGQELVVCFMEIGLEDMLAGVSMRAQENGATFCNIYTTEGVALSNTVLGGLAVEDNLLSALKSAQYDPGYSYESFLSDFVSGRRGETSFTYNGIRETLSYIPVEGTSWRLTYLIRESVITEQISAISNGIILRSIVQSILTVLVLFVMFAFIISQTRRNARLQIEKQTADAENRIKQQELEEKLALQVQLLEQEQQRKQQDSMITAMASDYRSVYHVDLDKNEAVCYRADPDDREQHREMEPFPYLAAFQNYGKTHVSESYRAGFLKFIEPENIREGLSKDVILAYRYLVKRAGKEYYEMIRVAGVRHAEDRDDGCVHAIGLGLTVIDAEMRDSLSQQQALSDALAAAEQASRAKTAFLSSMSHEIRTPMNAIIGLDNIALNDPATPPKTREYLEKIGSSAEHLLNLINDILDMSRIESGRMTLRNEEFSFSKLLETINTMFSGQCADKGLDYQCHIRGQVDDFYIGDNMKLRQVLINILGNAVKFTPEGGSVELTVEKTAQFENQSTLCFRVRDTGIGMSREFLPHIFDTFSQEDSSATSKYGSSGLGLAITKSIVEMMNGSIDVESEKGVGSTFTVSVTLMNSERRDSEHEIDVIPPQEMVVLIVDDDPVACEHAKLVLSKAGIASETAESGAAAIEMVRLRHARRESYNLILVDWKMPDMDGVETTRRIREIIGDESAIIILTAYRWDDILEEALRAGVDSFISKPLFAGTLLEEFKSAVKRKGLVSRKIANKAELKGRHLLLAEDVPVNAEIMMMVLGMREMTADLAENGRVALESLIRD